MVICQNKQYENIVASVDISKYQSDFFFMDILSKVLPIAVFYSAYYIC